MNKIRKLFLILLLASLVCSCTTLSSIFSYGDTEENATTFLSRVSNVEGNFISLSLSFSLSTSNFKFSSTGENITIKSTPILGESSTSIYNFVGLTSSTRGIYQTTNEDGSTTYCGVLLTSETTAYIYIGISVSNKNLVFVQPSYEFDVPTEDQVLSGDNVVVETEPQDEFLVAVKNKTAYVTILDVKHGLVFSSDGKTLTFTSSFTSGGTVKLSYESSSSSTTAIYKITSSSVSGYTVGNSVTVTRTTAGGTFNNQTFTWN